MKLPRDLSADELARALKRTLGYELTRRKGSHLRLTSKRGGEHHVTLLLRRRLTSGRNRR